MTDVTPAHALMDAEFLSTLRSQMLRFATLQLNSDHHLAEDAVQEALIGALRNVQSFAGKSAFKTWVFAILKNKIADILRQRSRYVQASQLLHSEEEEENFDALFDAHGHWLAENKPKAWGNPDEAMQDQHFWMVFEACMEHLPGQQARAFMMREFVGLESPEICESMEISMSNLNVMLHRARLRLRECLSQRWFLQGESS
ncbi:MAG: RNA polymerase factor sigma-70 [Pseudomonadales bacterium]|nr:RNA polymerase factor sigma-70 [Pseudomonadales bacterium]